MATWRRTTSSPADDRGPLPPHATPSRRHGGVLRLIERLLLLVGIACLGYYGYVSAEAALYQAFENRELEAILASGPAPDAMEPRKDAPAANEPAATGGAGPSAPASEANAADEAATTSTAPRPAARKAPRTSATIGRIEIPRLGVDAIVRSGDDAKTLRLAVGHIPGTALPGEGNTGLAAHRDTFFRRLGSIKEGDEIRVVTPDGTYRYTVEHTQVVEPTDVWVLDPTEQPALTLVTCYPFRYIGAAPQRFIVRAQLIS